MKYRCLTDDELKELETEFKQFLITNGVHTEEWEELNKTKDDKVYQLVEIFSDIVLERALNNIKYLEHITEKDIKAFRCDMEEMTLIGITVTKDGADLTNHSLAEMQGHLSIFKTSKAYNKERSLEVFDLLQSGCSIIDEDRFGKLDLAYQLTTKTAQN